MAKFSTNWSEFASGSSPVGNGWSEYWGSATWQVLNPTSVASPIEGGKVLRCNVPALGTVSLTLDAAGSAEGTQEVLILLRHNTVGQQYIMGSSMRVSGGAGSQWAILHQGYVSGSDARNFLRRFANGSVSNIANSLSSPSAPFFGGAWIWMRSRVSGSTAYAKVWAVDPGAADLGFSNEPGLWDYSGSISGGTPAVGAVGINARAVGNLDFAYVGIGMGGDSAPDPEFVKPSVSATAENGRAVVTWDPDGSENDFRLYRRPAPDGIGAGDWVLSAVIPGPVAEHLPYTDLTSSPCEEWEYTVREVEDGEEQPQYVPDTVAIPCLSADTISATLEGALLARIDVTSPSDTATQRTLQASASSDFASFVEIPQEGGPLPAVLYDVTGEAGARRYYRTAVTDGLSTAYSNVVYLDFPAEPGPAKPVLTVEAVGVNFVVVSLSAPAVPAGHSIAAIELAIYFDGDLVRNETIPIADPDDPGQPWREQAIEEIYPSEETFTVTGRWISDSTPDSDPTFSPGPYSDPKTFTLLDIPEEDPEPDEPEEAGTIDGFDLHDEWPIPQYNLRFRLGEAPSSGVATVQADVFRGGVHINRQYNSSPHSFPVMQFGAMLPGVSYQIVTIWSYWVGNARRRRSYQSLVTLPLANVPPYFKIEPGVSFTEPTTIEFDQHQHPSFEGHDVITEGAWPVEITRDGETWVRLTDDARIEPYEFDPASYTSGYAQFRVRNEPAEGAPSRWRTSPPVYLHPPEYFWRHAGDELTVDLFETGGSGEWSQVGEAEDRRVRYVGGRGTGGYAALKHVGQPRTFEVTTVGQWATGHAGHWMYGFRAEMYAHWGVGAFLRDDPYTALTARLGSRFGAWGRWIHGHIGEAGSPWWQNGQRYGRGSMNPYIGRYGPGPSSNPAAAPLQGIGSTRNQWLGGAASVVGVPLSPWYTVRARYTLLETELDGSHRIRVQMQFWGPDSDRSAGFSLSYEYRGIEWPCGPPGLLAVSGSNNVIDFQSITVLAEDYGTCPLPEGTDFLASASGSPCDPLIAIFWRHGHGGS